MLVWISRFALMIVKIMVMPLIVGDQMKVKSLIVVHTLFIILKTRQTVVGDIVAATNY